MTMIGVERIGGTLPTATSQLLDRITGNYREVPYSHYEIDNTWNQIANWSDIDMGTILKSYGRTFISNPVHLLRTILLRTEFVWAVKQIPSGGFIDSVIWNDADIYGYERIITRAERCLGYPLQDFYPESVLYFYMENWYRHRLDNRCMHLPGG
jgi:hypothetical protein